MKGDKRIVLMQLGLKFKNKKFISCLVFLIFMCSFILMARTGTALADPGSASDPATSLTIKVGYTSSSNQTSTYTTVRTFTYEEMNAMANVQQAYSYIDSMPAPVIDAARGVLISDLLTAAGIDTGANMSNINKIYFYCTDTAPYWYTNLTGDYLYGTPRYYYPNIVKSWNADEQKPTNSGGWGSPTDGAVQVYPILAIEDNWDRFQDPPDFNNMIGSSRFRLLNGQTESDYTNGVFTAMKSARWVCEIDVMLNQAMPPVLTANAATLGQPATLSYTDDADWRSVISGITVDGITVDSGKYSVAEGTITIDQSIFTSAEDYTIVVSAAGYSDVSVTQTMNTASTNVWDGSVDVSWYNTIDTVFYIDTPAKLAGLAAIVNGIYNEGAGVTGNPDYIVANVGGGTVAGSTTSTWIYGSDDFDGKTVYLTADLDMGGIYNSSAGTWSGPNYMPIGGQYCMTYQDGTTFIGASWNGTFDGQGHTVKNIYCSRHAGSLGYSFSQSVGLIGRLGIHDNDVANGYNTLANPSVKNVAVSGSIYANRSVGGIVGKNGKSIASVIENCINYASVSNTDSKGVGGIAGAGWNNLTIKNCANFGSIYTSYSNAGGISGSCEADIFNCYNVGYVNASSANQAQSLGTNNGGAVWTNCYWLDGSSASNEAVYGNTTGSTITQMPTTDSMKTTDFLAALNGEGQNWLEDTNNINNGYPVPNWQATGEDTAKYTVTPVTDEAYRNGTTTEGLTIMTVKPEVSGLHYFAVEIAPEREHSGEEAAVFVHIRDGYQLSLNVTKADFDAVNNATAGFNVRPGDKVKVFIVDDLTNDEGFNPTILQ